MLILNIITLANLILLFCVLYFKKDNALPNKVLALTFINPGVNFLSNIIILSGWVFSLPYFYFFGQINCFLLAPLMYSYVNLFIGRKIRVNDPLFIISGSFMLLVAYFGTDFYLLNDAKQQKYILGIINEPYPFQMVLTNTLFITMNQVYFTISAYRIFKYKKQLHRNLSNFEKTRYRYIAHFGIVIWILNLIAMTLYATLPTITVEYIILPLVITAFYFYILTYSFSQNSVFTKQAFEVFVKDNEISKATIESKPESEKISEGLETFVEQLKTYLTEKEPFTNPELTLQRLAEECDVSINKLSFAINKGFNKNFYDLINEKRIEKSKILLTEMAVQNTIEYIAYESGFNSRASFYRAFKKYTGLTPTQYLEKDSILKLGNHFKIF